MVLVNAVEYEKEVRTYQTERKEIKLALFSDDMITYR